MALVVKDRVKETTTTTGTGTYTLGGAVTGFETFTANLSNSDTTYYTCTDGTNFEVGIGTFTSSGTTLARTTILASSNSNNEVNWSSGSREIFITYPADKAVFKDASGHITIPDDKKLYFGTGEDTYLEYDEDGTDKLIIKGNTTFLDGAYDFDIASHDGSNGLKLGGTLVTSTAAEINLIDGGTARGTTSVASGDGILINDGGTMRMTNVDTVSTYFSSHNVGGSNIVTTGALNSGSITSGFGTIDTGSSTITTTGLISGGSLDIDDVLINGTTIGHTDDPDLITLADGVVTVAGEISVTTLDIGGTNVTSTAAELNILDGKAFLDEDDMSTNSATGIASQQSIKAYVDAQQSMGSGFVLEDDDGTEVTVTEDKEVKIIGSGVTTNWTDTSTGSDGDPYDLTITVDAAQTGITSLLATDIKIGEDDQTKIDFETADEIHFYAANVEQVYLADNIFGPQSDSDVDLGTTGVRWKDAFVDSVTVTDNVTIGGNLTVNGTTTTIDTTNTVVKDSLLGLNNGASSNSNDSGIIIERGSTGNDALLIWDESADKWALGTTTSNASSTGNLNMTTGTLVANIEGNVTGNLTGTASLATTVTITDNESTNEENAVIFTAGGDVDGGNLGLESDGDLTYNPSTGTVSATVFKGNIDAVDGDFDGTLEADAITVGGTALNTVIAGVTVTNATNSAHVLVTDNESTNEENLITFVEGATDSTGNVGLEMDGNLTYNPSTGRLTATQLSGTLQTAAQANVTSLGTLTTLTVDNVIINGTTIGHTDDTDLMTVADGVLTVAGEVSMTTLDIGGTNVTATAAELNYVDGVTSAIQTQMDTKTTPGFALAMAICL